MKYELTDMVLETECGLVLHRIRALRDIPERGVAAGDSGGWVESEANLSQDYNAWVSGDACVAGNACVSGDACVSDRARVYGKASVYGNARVFGDALVFDNACVAGDARVFGDALVFDNAHVYSDAHVYGDAHVYDDAYVYGNAHVYGYARVCGDARLPSRNSIFMASYVGTENGTLTVMSGVSGLVVTRGCFTGSVDEFLERSREFHDDKTHNEYRMLIEVAKSRIPVHAVPDTED